MDQATDPAARMPTAEGASPAMAQWFALKSAHPDAILFFRMGDFFEMFFADAEAASEALDIALTYRGEHQGTKVPMCGAPARAGRGAGAGGAGCARRGRDRRAARRCPSPGGGLWRRLPRRVRPLLRR